MSQLQHKKNTKEKQETTRACMITLLKIQSGFCALALKPKNGIFQQIPTDHSARDDAQQLELRALNLAYQGKKVSHDVFFYGTLLYVYLQEIWLIFMGSMINVGKYAIYIYMDLVGVYGS